MQLLATQPTVRDVGLYHGIFGRPRDTTTEIEIAS
jgi:hypothetical protein